MPRGVDQIQKASVNQADPTSLRGVSAANPATIVFPAPPDRGVGVAPSSTETNLPR